MSDIILTINTASDDEMRMSFLKKLEGVIHFSCGVFYMGSNTDNQKKLINPTFYKHPYQKVSNPNDLCNEYNKFQNRDYGNYMYWLHNSIVYRDSDMLPNSVIPESTEMYQKIYSPLGMHYGCGITLIYDKVFLGEVILFREKGHPDFTDKDLFILNYLQPHLTHRMYQLHPQGKYQINAKGTICKEYGLTQREFEIITLICKGYSNKEISMSLFISEETIKKHTQHIFSKMNVKSRSKLIRKCTEEQFKLNILD
ncbi:response regulator transcription factor [Neobacillus sp. LXY-1]|uniref:response regulator transcription factor n=1 Tax=Neobacillus sp. LXY-1 TaxID=3379133 RepID=UPI003EDEA98C